MGTFIMKEWALNGVLRVGHIDLGDLEALGDAGWKSLEHRTEVYCCCQHLQHPSVILCPRTFSLLAAPLYQPAFPRLAKLDLLSW